MYYGLCCSDYIGFGKDIAVVPMKLTDKQSLFCEQYMVDLNATQAAIRAGYSEKTARQVGSENLAKPDISETIQKLKDKKTRNTEVTVKNIVEALARLAFDEDKHDKTNLKGLELLGKHLDIFSNDKIDANINLIITNYSTTVKKDDE